MTKLAILASGSGTNAENIIQHFKNHASISVSSVICNRKDAFVFKRAEKHNITTHYIKASEFSDGNRVLNLLKKEADYIILAGFLLKVPENIIQGFPNKIINIHPALLPKYGGKGMYGMHVHKAVRANDEKESGITIHYVNENYDEGAIIFQAQTSIENNDTPEDIASKIHTLEQENFPRVIEEVILNKQ